MTMADEQLKMNPDALWRDETYTDQQAGAIRVLTPVTREGERDTSRAVQYIGQVSMYTPAGPLPISFALEANNLEEACADFPEAARKAADETMAQLREMQRQQASKIVVPGAEEKSRLQLP